MLFQIGYAVSFFLICFFTIVSGIDLPERYRFFFSCLIATGFFYWTIVRKGNRPFLLQWLKTSALSLKIFSISSSSLFLCTLFFLLIPQTGIKITFFDQQNNTISEQIINLNTFEIIPPLIKENVFHPIVYSCRVSARFINVYPIHHIQYYISHGNARWTMDGLEVATFKHEDSTRHQVDFSEIAPSIHEIACDISNIAPFPRISIDINQGNSIGQTLLQGPFFYSNQSQMFSFIKVYHYLIAIFGLLAFFFFIPTLNYFLYSISSVVKKYSPVLTVIAVLSVTTFSVLLYYHFQEKIMKNYDADEAAFGVMANRLLLGQSPPLFHYGQNYQGTYESIPLSLFLHNADDPAKSLHFLPQLFGFLFVSITVLTFLIYGNIYLALFTLLYLGIGGTHFYWIINKSWFGYSSSLFLGSSLWLIALYSYKKGSLTPGIILLWSLIAGTSLYELPLSSFFIFGSFLVVTPLFFNNYSYIKDKRPNFSNKILSYFNNFLIYTKTAFLIFFFLLFLFPYWISPFFQDRIDAVGFLLSGRKLPHPGENPFFDRFLCEILPTFLGLRAPFDLQHDLQSSFFTGVPCIFFLVSIIVFPFFSKKYLPYKSVLSANPIRYAIFLFTLLTVFVVSYSSFGSWPWYTIPLYWSIPILFYVFIRFLWSLSPSLSIAIPLLFFISILSALPSHTLLFHQPSSLAYQGLPISTDFEKIKTLLSKKEVRTVLCDQGYDYFEYETGRDWIGDCLLFDSKDDIITSDRLSRRFPASAQEVINSSRTGYIFHKDYYFNAVPSQDSFGFSLLSIETLKSIFGSEILQFECFDIDPYIVFLPQEDISYISKFKINLSASTMIGSYYLLSAIDNNICVRSSGRETYWSSGSISGNGIDLSLSFDKRYPVKKIVLFHGTKVSDRTKENTVFYEDNDGTKFTAGHLKYYPSSHCSMLELREPVITNKIIISVPKEERYWWTIFEIWIF